MTNLEQIINEERTKQMSANNAKADKQMQILDWTLNKCQNIISNLSVFKQYGFGFETKKVYCDEYGENYGFYEYCVIMRHGNHHFAYLYPMHKCDFDFYSYQIEMNGHKSYTYESATRAIVKRIRF